MIPLPGPGEPLDGPVLSPAGAWVAVGTRKGGDAAVVEVGPGGARALEAFDPLLDRSLARRTYRELRLDASADLVAVASTRIRWGLGVDPDRIPVDSEIAVAPAAGGAATVVHRCARGVAGAPSVAGSVVLWPTACDVDLSTGPDRGGTAVVRDFASRAQVTLQPRSGEGFVGGSVAGDYAALYVLPDDVDVLDVFDALSIAVLDWRRGRELYRVRSTGGFVPDRFDIASDGTLTLIRWRSFSDGDTCSSYQRLEWYSVAEPHAHRVPTELCLLRGGRLDVAGGYVPGQLGVEEGPHRQALQPLAGGPAIVVGEREAEAGPLAVDGERIARLREGCAGTQLVLDELATVRASGPPPAQRCAFTATASKRARVGRDGRAAPVAIHCPAGCPRGESVVAMTIDGHPDLPTYATLAAPAGGTAKPRLRVPQAVRKRLKRGGSLGASLRVTVEQPDGSRTIERSRTRLVAR